MSPSPIASIHRASVAAAEHLVDLVRRLCAAGPGEQVLELYAGVGLLSAALAADGARVTAVEASAAACRDARANTAGLDARSCAPTPGPSASIAGPVDAVLDPPRRGVGASILSWVAELAPTRVIYVSCDPATFARDARVLADRGFALVEVVGVDQFTHTGQVELVAAFRRHGAAAGSWQPKVNAAAHARAAARLASALLVAACTTALATPARAASQPQALDIPPPPPPLAASEPPAVPSREFVRQLERLQGFPQTSPDGRVGLAVIDGAGQRLAEQNPDTAMLPASTLKLVTAAAALRLLGPQHRFVTRVYATTPPDDAGVIDGDLVLVGGGDPVLATPRFIRQVNSERPATPLSDLAKAVARAGITRVTGRVVGDPSILADEPLAKGWTDGYLTSMNTTRSSGLTVDAGVRLFSRSGVLYGEPAKDPAIRAAGQLHELLDARDVKVERTPASRRTHRPAGVEIARVYSPPLATLLTYTLQNSDNHLADGIFRMLGAAAGDPTWAGSARAARLALSDIGADWERIRLADGSGLSRHNRLTADATVRLLHTMAGGPLRADWLDMQATAGESGTMRRRLAQTQAKGRVHAKTGTLRDVRSLAGTVPDPDGRDHHFAVFANDLEAFDDIAASRRLGDVLALALVVEQDGCLGPTPIPEPRAPRPPEAVICGTSNRD